MSYNQGGGYGQDNYNNNNGGGYGQQQQRGEAAEFYNQGGNNGYGQQQYGGPGQEPPQYQQYPSTAGHSSNSGRNSQNQGYQNQYGGEGNPEGDRGIMGGLAGGAAGAFGGHKLGGQAGHGAAGTIIGAIGGAFAGHKAQDAASDWKHEHDDKKKWEKEQEEQKKHNQQQQQHHGGPPPQHNSNDARERGDFGGNFTASSRDVRLDAHGDFNLHAQCARTDGSYSSSTISLNKYIENDNGSFRCPAAAATAPPHTPSSRATHCAPLPPGSRTARSRISPVTTTSPTPIRSGPVRTCRFPVAAPVVEATSARRQGMSGFSTVARSWSLSWALSGTQGRLTSMRRSVTGTGAWSSSRCARRVHVSQVIPSL